MRAKLFQRLGFLAGTLWLAASVACSGMTGLGGAPGAGGFADGGSSNSNSEIQENDTMQEKSGGGDSGPAGGPASLAPGALPSGSAPGGPTTTTLYAPGPAAVAAADPFGGYRPGSEGQVQVGRSHMLVSTIGPNGANNCNRDLDDEWVQVFPAGSSGATIYSWLSHAADGPFDPTGRLVNTKETGAARVDCYIPKDDGSITNFEHVMLLATYTDHVGTVHRSDTITVACPSQTTYEIKYVCLDLKIPPVQMQYQGIVLPPSSNYYYLNSGDAE